MCAMMIKKETKWPGPVTFNEDDPKLGFAYIHLSIPEMKLVRSRFSKKVPDNINIDCTFTSQSISAKVTIDNVTEQTIYEYNKQSPEDLDSRRSKFKAKNGLLLLEIAKANTLSWTPHARHFIEKPDDDTFVDTKTNDTNLKEIPAVNS